MLQNKGEEDSDTETQTGHREEVHVTSKTEIGVMQFTNKETPRIIRGHQKLGGGEEEFYPNLQSDCDLADTLIQISGQNCERIISIVLSHPVCDTLLWQP